MAAYDLLSFNGTSIAAGTNYSAYLDERDQYVVSASVDSVARRSASPLVQGTAHDGRSLTVRVTNATGSALTAAQFRDAIKELFDPFVNAAGTRLLVMEGDDGTTDVQIGCYVMGWEYRPIDDQYTVSLWAPSPVWQAAALVTSASNPATVTNLGNTPALPTIELTTTTHKTRRVCTVDSASPALPLIGYPVVFLLSDTAATSTNTFVYIEGNSVPCYVDDSGLATSRVWALVDAVASEIGPATNVDIIYGTGLVNPLCQTLPDGGLDWDDATNCHNTQWEWNDMTVASNPNRPGSWRPALTGKHDDAADVSYQITNEAAAGTTIGIGAAGTYDNTADSLRLTVGPTASTLTNFRRVTTGLDGANARAYVRVRQFSVAAWADAWTTLANATVTTAISTGTASDVVAGIENFGATADPATLLVGSATNDNRLTITNGPTVVVGAAVNVDYLNGVITIGSRTITFTNFLCPDGGTLTIDCENRTITHSVAGPFYGGEDAIVFSDPDQFLVLAPGSNSVSNTTGGALVVKHRGAFS